MISTGRSEESYQRGAQVSAHAVDVLSRDRHRPRSGLLDGLASSLLDRPSGSVLLLGWGRLRVILVVRVVDSRLADVSEMLIRSPCEVLTFLEERLLVDAAGGWFSSFCSGVAAMRTPSAGAASILSARSAIDFELSMCRRFLLLGVAGPVIACLAMASGSGI